MTQPVPSRGLGASAMRTHRYPSELRSLSAFIFRSRPCIRLWSEALDLLCGKVFLPWFPHHRVTWRSSTSSKTFGGIGPTILKPCTLQMEVIYEGSHLIILYPLHGLQATVPPATNVGGKIAAGNEQGHGGVKPQATLVSVARAAIKGVDQVDMRAWSPGKRQTELKVA